MIYLKEKRGFASDQVDNLGIICYVLMAVLCVLVGKLSDVIGRQRIYFIMLGVIILICFQVTYIIEFGTWVEVGIAQLILACLAAAYIAPEPTLQAELFPAKVRSTALAVSYNLGVTIFGGTALYVFEKLVQNTGSLGACSNYIVIVSIFGMIGIAFYKNRSKEAKL